MTDKTQPQSVDPQDIINALSAQRNDALNAVAIANAHAQGAVRRLIASETENARLKAELAKRAKRK